MELSSPLPLSFLSCSDSSSSSSPSTTFSISTVSAGLKESSCDDPISASCLTANSVTSPHQLGQYCSCMIPVYDTCQAGHGSKKRKVVSSDQQKDKGGAHGVSTLPAMLSLQLNCSAASVVEGEYQEEEQEEEGQLAGCTTPPHLQSSACNGAHDRLHDYKFELPVANNADPDREQTLKTRACTADDHELRRCHNKMEGDGSDHGLERTESIPILSFKCGCSCGNSIYELAKRGQVPPPPPRKPKATPRILTSTHLNFFVPPDLELFFSNSASFTAANYTAATHDPMKH